MLFSSESIFWFHILNTGTFKVIGFYFKQISEIFSEGFSSYNYCYVICFITTVRSSVEYALRGIWLLKRNINFLVGYVDKQQIFLQTFSITACIKLQKMYNQYSYIKVTWFTFLLTLFNMSTELLLYKSLCPFVFTFFSLVLYVVTLIGSNRSYLQPLIKT